ncbi:hypothetical protein EUTSA_v10013411mg [Eutrema salsugineum]|uniref:Uncharacterized protein n=1 Tax=Eutrema salsugineum TaxID=72664 RepID=V4NBS9_EUTSA|nr:protein YLS7 [Eutrema salsugineum]ESQ43386.1 hypothetical protein EUTSA_v10013411mg [Eutrema salsugineum]
MTLASPRRVSSIAFAIGGLASFFIFASLLLLTHPIGSSVSGYFYGTETTQHVEFHHSSDDIGTSDSNPSLDSSSDSPPLTRDREDPNESTDARLGEETKSGRSTNISMDEEEATQDSVETECDLYHGNWFYDPMGPSYTNNSCPLLTQMQNCQGNGRPDKGYENWRWKPSQCDLPRFDAKKFLELMKGKTLAFIGDSVARNQMESMMCLLWQVETPVNRGNRKMQRWYFRSSSVMIARMWSSWLVHQFNEPFGFAPQGVTKLKLDQPDERIIEALPKFDVVVLSSGHWFAKQSVYILNDEIVGGQLWWPDKSKQENVNNVEAFGISVETILKAIAKHPNYKGLTILRTWSPDHYEGGAWNTGGSCTGKVEPLSPGKLVKNGFTEIMHEKQATGFQRAVADDKLGNRSKKLKLMDITEAFGYRHDGHPGPYRSPDPKKITKRGPDGQPPPQDCLHWCMPGPVDTWNEMVLEIIRRDMEGGRS